MYTYTQREREDRHTHTQTAYNGASDGQTCTVQVITTRKNSRPQKGKYRNLETRAGRPAKQWVHGTGQDGTSSPSKRFGMMTGVNPTRHQRDGYAQIERHSLLMTSVDLGPLSLLYGMHQIGNKDHRPVTMPSMVQETPQVDVLTFHKQIGQQARQGTCCQNRFETGALVDTRPQHISRLLTPRRPRPDEWKARCIRKQAESRSNARHTHGHVHTHKCCTYRHTYIHTDHRYWHRTETYTAGREGWQKQQAISESPEDGPRRSKREMLTVAPRMSERSPCLRDGRQTF